MDKYENTMQSMAPAGGFMPATAHTLATELYFWKEPEMSEMDNLRACYLLNIDEHYCEMLDQ